MLDIKIIQRQLDKLEKYAQNNQMGEFIKTLKIWFQNIKVLIFESKK